MLLPCLTEPWEVTLPDGSVVGMARGNPGLHSISTEWYLILMWEISFSDVGLFI